jgi:Holliday junction resolvasome RuvABC endonuclease subunit
MGLDLSLSCTGLAVLDDGEAVHLQKIPTGTGDGSTIERCDYISTVIGSRVRKYQPECIVIEEYAFSKSGSKLGELGGLVKRELWRVTGVSECWITAVSSSVKLLVAGSGKASKQDMVAAVASITEGWPVAVAKDHNVADAIGLCLWAKASVLVESS